MARADSDFFLEQLGICRGAARGVSVTVVVSVFHITFLALLVALAVLEYRLGLHPLVLTVAIWVVWTFWHSYLLESSRRRYLRSPGNAYRKAFIRNILPGASVAIAQVWRPILNGEVLAGWESGTLHPFLPPYTPLVLAGLAGSVVSVVLLTRSVQTIGLANAAFVPEYVGTDSFQPRRTGLYALGRHPMFWSGVLFSACLSLVAATPASYMIAIVNVVYGTVYSHLEDRRLCRVFGRSYMEYKEALPSCMPLGRWLPRAGATPVSPVSPAVGE